MAVTRSKPRRKTPGRRPAAASSPAAANLTTADLVVLGLLADQPRHGYALLREYERQEVADWAAVSRPHVYYALTKLARHGLVVPAGEEQSGGGRDAGAEPAAGKNPRRRVVFALTATGEAALAGRLADPGWARGRHPEPFTTWLGLSLHVRPAERAAVLAERRAFLEAEVGREEKTLLVLHADPGAGAALGAAMVDLRLRCLRVELDWLVAFCERLLPQCDP